MYKAVSSALRAFVVTCVVWGLLGGVGPAAAESWVGIDDQGGVTVKDASFARAPEVRVERSDTSGTRVTVTTAGIYLNERNTPLGRFVHAGWPDAAVFGAMGTPALPVVRRVVWAPPGADVSLSIDAGPSIILDETQVGVRLRVLPVQPPLEKLPGAADRAPFEFDPAVYARDVDVPQPRAEVTEFGIVRGHRLLLLEVRPVACNPAASTLTVWPRMTVDVRFQGGDRKATRWPAMSGLDRVVLNPPSGQPEAATGNYLILVANTYATAITPFAQAKTAQGFTVTTHRVTPGTPNTAIKTYIQGLWSNPETAPEYILLVGDTDTIPHWTGGGEGSPATDLPYTCMDGPTDWFPDIAIGRFPVRSPAQLGNVVDKTLYFENGPLTDPSYLSRAVFMASEDNYTVSEGTHNWTIANYMDPNNIESDRLYCHTYNATTQQVRDAFNGGRIYGIYSGHGGEYEWADGPPFSQSDVNGLTNADMYAFVCSFACVTGTYTVPECFTETWILAPNKGAAAILGSSVNSYWTEDDVLQRRLFEVLYDDYVRELGAAFNLTRVRYAEQMGTGQTTRRYFEMYNLLGDPSLAIPDAEAALRVSPADALRAEGPEGGPFAPAAKTYTVRNVADYPIDYAVTHQPGVNWVTLSGAVAGTLPPQQTADVTVTINASANALPTGTYDDVIQFTNTTDHVGDATRDVVLEVGRYVFNATDVPQPILDNSTTTSVLTVNEHFCIGDLDVSVNISHTYIGDLIVSLRSPDGTTVTLHNRGGGSTDDLVVTYDDEGTPPEGPGTLADFDQQSPIGDWTLTVQDLASQDQGTLNAWALRVLPAGDVCPPVALDAEVHTAVNTPVDITLEGNTMVPGLLDFIILTLPAHGSLADPAAGAITSVPYTLADYGQVVRYTPLPAYQGNDQFQFKVFDGGQESAPATVTITVGGPQPIHVFSMDTNPGWTTTGQWGFGQPTGQGDSDGYDPSSGYTGTNVYGYNLNGDYQNSTPVYYLTSTPIDCAGVSNVELRFMRWLGVESSQYDHANVQVSNNGSTWVTVWEHSGGSFCDTSWQPVAYDLSSVADDCATVYVRWGMGPTDYSVTFPGWNIDDVEIWGIGAMPGDCNHDGRVDLFDFAIFDGCYCGPNGALGPGCEVIDLDGDNDVDMKDLAVFLLVFTG